MFLCFHVNLTSTSDLNQSIFIHAGIKFLIMYILRFLVRWINHSSPIFTSLRIVISIIGWESDVSDFLILRDSKNTSIFVCVRGTEDFCDVTMVETIRLIDFNATVRTVSWANTSISRLFVVKIASIISKPVLVFIDLYIDYLERLRLAVL